MQRIKHLSVSPALAAALVDSLGAAFQRPRHLFNRSTVALLVGLIVACAALAAVLLYLTYR
jgi:hypothetical protein